MCGRQVGGIKVPRLVRAAKATSCRGKNLHLSFWYPQSLLMFLFKVILHLKTLGAGGFVGHNHNWYPLI